MVKQHKSLRETTVSKIRDAMFSLFGKGKLDAINTNAISVEIMAWKQFKKTLDCFKNLYMTPEGKGLCTVARISKKVWPREDASIEQFAFTISIY